MFRFRIVQRTVRDVVGLKKEKSTSYTEHMLATKDRMYTMSRNSDRKHIVQVAEKSVCHFHFLHRAMVIAD